MEKKFEVNWEYVKDSQPDILSAMFYLLQSMDISINEERYNSLTPRGKTFFKLK